MAVATFDHSFSVAQDSKGRLGLRFEEKEMTAAEREEFNSSSVMQKQRNMDELTKQWSRERDEARAARDPTFKPKDSDFSAPKAFDFDSNVNLYEMLGVDEHASFEEIKVAYRQLSLQYHPDKTSGLSPEQKEEYGQIFIDLKNGYLVLGDQATRRQYDKERDKDRARMEIFKTKPNKRRQHNAVEILRRIKEGKKPPGKVIEVPVELNLEMFFYGGSTTVKRARKIKNQNGKLVDEDHGFRLEVPKGAEEPLEKNFLQMGDYSLETKPDDIRFIISSKSHSIVQRQGSDLLVKSPIQLRAGALTEPYLTAHTPTLNGRHLILWGRNPFFHAGGTGNAKLLVRVKDEGLALGSFLHVQCLLGSSIGSRKNAPNWDRSKARKFLAELVAKGEAKSFQDELAAAQKLWRGGAHPAAQKMVVDLWDGLLDILPEYGFSSTRIAMQEAVGGALKAVEGEWGLMAKISGMSSAMPFPLGANIMAGAQDEGRSPSLKSFFERHQLTSEPLESPEDVKDLTKAESAEHGQGGMCDAPPMMRRLNSRQQQDLNCEVELLPVAESLTFGIWPRCKLRFFTDAQEAFFAVSVSSEACADEAAAELNAALKERIVPAVQATVFSMWQAARRILPRQLADFSFPSLTKAGDIGAVSVPWKRLGDEAFKRADYYTAISAYSKCLDEGPGDDLAVVLSNRAASLAKLGFFAESLEDAKKCCSERPTWGKAWARAALAAAELGEEYDKEAQEAHVKAVAFGPSSAAVKALMASTVKTGSPSKEAALEAKKEGDEAMADEAWGTAIAQYSVGIALLHDEEEPNHVTMPGKEATPWSLLHANRSAAFIRARNFEMAIADAIQAVKTNQLSVVARNRLGTAYLAAGNIEKAYMLFSQAAWMDATNESGFKGQEACLYQLPKWQSQAGIERIQKRSQMDIGRPRDACKVWAISDVMFDKDDNDKWVKELDDTKFQDDVLIVAGNIAQSMTGIVGALTVLKSKFRRVFYTPGNREMWLNVQELRIQQYADSLTKLLAIFEKCDEIGVDVFPAAVCQDVHIVPLLSWYNADFEKEVTLGKKNEMVDGLCKWSLDPATQVYKYMMKLNEAHLQKTYKGTVITCSHFLPSTQLPTAQGEDKKTMGCEDLEDQLMEAQTKMHVYGHTKTRSVEQHGRVRYVNHNCDPDYEDLEPLCIFDGLQGGICAPVQEKMGRQISPIEDWRRGA